MEFDFSIAVDFANLGAVGYFIYLVRDLKKDIKEVVKHSEQTRNDLTNLTAEHNTYKALNKCPIMSGAAGE